MPTVPAYRHLVTGLLLALVLAVPGTAQWKGNGRLAGRVLDERQEPLAGASVRVHQLGAPNSGPQPVETNGKGKWSLLGLAPGIWTLKVEARGYHWAEGKVQIGGGPGGFVEVELRPLTEVPPSFAEGASEHFAAEASAMADTLLAQGETEAARTHYLRGLRALDDPSARASLMLRIARTHHLEGDPARTEALLRQALVLDPDSAIARQLYQALSPREAETWLARLDREGPAAVGTELEPIADLASRPPAPPPTELVVDDPVPGRTGTYSTHLVARSALSSFETFLARYGIERDLVTAQDPQPMAYTAESESLDLFVPESYRPEDGWGLLVWVSPGPRGGVGSDETRALLEERRLIWAGANASGNARGKWDRVGLAIDVAQTVTSLYRIDPDRIFVGGYSGGGRIASALANLWSDVFRGGFFIHGADFYQPIAIPDRPGSQWPPMFPEPPQDRLSRLKKEQRYVLLTGQHDFNRVQTRETAEAYRTAGFRHVTYLEVPEASHYTQLPTEWIARLLDALLGGSRRPPNG